MALTDRRVQIEAQLAEAQGLCDRAKQAVDAATVAVIRAQAQLALIDDLIAKEVPPSLPSDD